MGIEVFISYARKDEALRQELEKHLAGLQQQGFISTWHDRNISAGTEWKREIDTHLNQAQIILLLISPDFMKSDYCYGVEMKHAMKRYERGEARVVPVILRPVDWQDSPFSKLQVLPKDARPVTTWRNQDEAFLSAAEGIRDVVKGLRANLKPTLGSIICYYKGHSSRVNTVTWSPDGRSIASGSMDGEVQIWDAAKGTKHLTFEGHFSPVWAVAWSPDGKYIASCSGAEEVVHDAYDGYSDWVDCVVNIWDASTGHEKYVHRGHNQVVTNVIWSPDGTRVASASFGGTVQVWDAMTGYNQLTFKGDVKDVDAVSWSLNGKQIASVDSIGTVRVWDAMIGYNQLTFKGHHETFEYPGHVVAWSPKGRFIASGGDRTVQIWDTHNGHLLLSYRGHADSVKAVAWSPEGTWIASAGDDETVQVWEAATGKHIFTFSGHTDSVKAVAWSPEGTWIASAGDDERVLVLQVL